MQHPSSSPESRFLRQALVAAAFLGLVAIVSLPAARGAGPVGWMPLWLVGMPLIALAALRLAGRGGRVAATPVARLAAANRRARSAQARRRKPAHPARLRRRAAAPAA